MTERIINQNIIEELLLIFDEDIRKYPELKRNIKLMGYNWFKEYREEDNFIRSNVNEIEEDFEKDYLDLLHNWEIPDIFRYYLNVINLKEFEKKLNIPLILQAISKDNCFMFYVFVKFGCDVNMCDPLMSGLYKNTLGYVKGLLVNRRIIISQENISFAERNCSKKIIDEIKKFKLGYETIESGNNPNKKYGRCLKCRRVFTVNENGIKIHRPCYTLLYVIRNKQFDF